MCYNIASLISNEKKRCDDFTMSDERKHFIEICTGLVLIVIGFLLDWWSKQLLWIKIYPPPLAKQIIEVLPFFFWGLSALLIVDGVRRIILRKYKK